MNFFIKNRLVICSNKNYIIFAREIIIICQLINYCIKTNILKS